MTRRLKSIAITILWLGVRGNLALAQAPAGSILHVEIINSTLYRRGYCSIAEQGKNPTKLPTSTITPSAMGAGHFRLPFGAQRAGCRVRRGRAGDSRQN